jgi:hypothetical protein
MVHLVVIGAVVVVRIGVDHALVTLLFMIAWLIVVGLVCHRLQRMGELIGSLSASRFFVLFHAFIPMD